MHKIYIKQFMAIREMEIELDNALLLIGEQASGKSTVSKLVYFFKSLRQDLYRWIYESLETDQKLITQITKKIQDKFYDFFGSTRHLPDFEVTYFYTPASFITLSLYPDKGLKVHYEGNIFHSIFHSNEIKSIIQDINFFFGKTGSIKDTVFQSFVITLGNYINELFADKHIPQFIPAGRNITVSYPEQFKLNFYGGLRSDSTRNGSIESIPSVHLHLMIKFIEQTERIKDRFRHNNNFDGLIADKRIRGEQVNDQSLALAQEKINKILKGKYRLDELGEKLFYDDQNYVLLSQASSGQQEVIRILQDIFLVLLDQESAFRVIEEPEAHLYPMGQKHLIEMIALMLNHTNSQVIITTHSPYILSIFNNLLFATRVVNKDEKARQEVHQVIPESCWLSPDKCSAYFFKDGFCRSIFDRETGLIDQNALDEISVELAADFDDLYDIYGRSSE